jgi:hypothetical protein
MYASPQTLVRPCLGAKSTISELETDARVHPFEGRLRIGTRLTSATGTMADQAPVGLNRPLDFGISLNRMVRGYS